MAVVDIVRLSERVDFIHPYSRFEFNITSYRAHTCGMHAPRNELVLIFAVVHPAPWLSGEGKWMDVASKIARKLFAQAPCTEHCMSAIVPSRQLRVS